VCRCGGIQSNNVTKQCLTPLADDIRNVRQTGHVDYVDVLRMVLLIHTFIGLFYILFYNLLYPFSFHHCVCSVTTAYNLTPVKHDD